MSKASKEEEIIYADIDLDFLDGVRNQIPIGFQKRHDLYSVVDKEKSSKERLAKVTQIIFKIAHFKGKHFIQIREQKSGGVFLGV